MNCTAIQFMAKPIHEPKVQFMPRAIHDAKHQFIYIEKQTDEKIHWLFSIFTYSIATP